MGRVNKRGDEEEEKERTLKGGVREDDTALSSIWLARSMPSSEGERGRGARNSPLPLLTPYVWRGSIRHASEIFEVNSLEN